MNNRAGLSRRSRFLLIPALFLLCVTIPHLNQGDFRRDSGRYAAIGLYMWNGGDVLTPQLGPGVHYFNKPPIAFWMHGLSLKILGVNVVAARLPSILAALGVLLLSVATARTLGSRSEALVSGVVLALTYEFFRRTREVSLDFWQLLFVMMAVFLFARGLRTNCARLVTLSGIGLGLALLCKPFVALGLVPVFALWALVSRRPRLITFLLLGAVPLALLVAFPWHWHMYRKFGHEFIQQYIFHEMIGRAKGENGSAPAYYYIVQLATTYWPWGLAVGYAIYHRFRGRGPSRSPPRDLVLLGLIWVVFVLSAISLFADKSPNYALPLYPMLSWIVAAGICRLPLHSLARWYRRGLPWLAPATVALLLVLSVAPIRFQEGPNRDWRALFDWIRETSSSPSQFAAADLRPNDRCYFYLKTGSWLPDAETLGSFGMTNSPRWILSTSRAATGTLTAYPDTAFTSGPLQVFAATNWLAKVHRDH